MLWTSIPWTYHTAASTKLITGFRGWHTLFNTHSDTVQVWQLLLCVLFSAVPPALVLCLIPQSLVIRQYCFIIYLITLIHCHGQHQHTSETLKPPGAQLKRVITIDSLCLTCNSVCVCGKWKMWSALKISSYLTQVISTRYLYFNIFTFC